MAIGPQKNKRDAVLKCAEHLIDTAVRTSNGSGSITVQFASLGITVQEWEFGLKPKYRKAGWKKANFVGDQRDGDYIQLES